MPAPAHTPSHAKKHTTRTSSPKHVRIIQGGRAATYDYPKLLQRPSLSHAPSSSAVASRITEDKAPAPPRKSPHPVRLKHTGQAGERTPRNETKKLFGIGKERMANRPGGGVERGRAPRDQDHAVDRACVGQGTTGHTYTGLLRAII
jgi:hypothetical protein